MQLQIDPEFKSLIPPLSTDEYRLLEEGILSDGCRDALVVWSYIIIDGHNRYEICQKHGIEFNTMPISFESRDDAIIWIVKNQLGRRNLTTLARIELVKHLEPIFETKAKENQGTRTDIRQNSDKSLDPIDTKKEMAKLADVSHDTYARGSKILDESPEDIRLKVIHGDMSINQAYISLKRDQIKEQAKIVEAPKGKYRIIYADPPWQYTDKRDGNTTGAEDHYKTMSITELCELPIKDMTEDNAVLFLWVTSPLLAECFEVIKAWGFVYKTSFVWDKDAHNMGHYNSVRHEFLLIATKGSCLPDSNKLIPSVVKEKRNEHSVKPEIFRQIIDDLYTYGNRIELFARKQVDGWESWGDQVG